MKKAVFLFDIDDTCYNGFSQADLMKAELQEGLYDPKALKSMVDDLKTNYYKNHMDYEHLAEHFSQDMVGLLVGKKRDVFYQHAKEFFTKHIDKLSDFLPAIVDAYSKSHDFYFLSGGIDYSVQAIADIFKATGYVATTPAVKDGLYQSTLINDMAFAKDKAREATKIMKDYPQKGSIAFGDSSADAGMMLETETGICVHPSDDLKKLAQEHHWHIVEDRKKVFDEVKHILG